MIRRFVVPALVAALSLAAVPSRAQPTDWDAVQMRTEPVAEGVWLITGRGGDVGVSAGADGVLLIDGQYAQLTGKLLAAVKTISDQPVRWVLNTHWHGDHVGGDANLRRAGALVFAHENVRRRMAADQYIATFDRKVPASPPEALPLMTFSDSVTFHINGDTLVIAHVPPAHTDGDAVVWFRRADVLHTGDLFFNGTFPVIDVSNGGSIDGMIRACDLLLAGVGPGTRIIPGHGPLAGKAELKAFRDMLASVRAKVWPLVTSGRTREEAVAARPIDDIGAVWGKGFITGDAFVKTVFDDLARLKR
jgi:glyoxylase-like metal-dependent hydrolase (beta-lactamase superfamily II)